MSILQSVIEPKTAAKAERHHGATIEVAVSAVETELERL
jgi:hypothetical protein